MSLPRGRDYQERAYAEASRLSRIHRGILVQGPTGCGKTWIGIRIALGALAVGRSVLWLAPRIELVNQPAKRLVEYEVDVPTQIIRASGTSGPPDARIRIATIQTLVARDCTPEADLVIFDECRHFLAEEWNRIASAYRGAHRVGLDATPVRTDGRALGDLFDVIVPVASVAELQAGGWLVPVRTLAPAQPQEQLASTPLEAYRKHAPGTRAFVFCASVAESKRQADLFSAAGFPARHLDGTSSEEDRAWALDALRAGRIRVLTNVQLFTEGVDVPELETVIVARGCSSEATWLQMVGRGLRPAPDKTALTLLDLRGHSHTFGLVDDPRTYHLTGEAIRRQEKLDALRCCRGCLAWFRSGPTCPHCGREAPPPKAPRVRAADLVEVRSRQPEAVKRADWEGILLVARGRGHRLGWALNVYRGRYGNHPPREWIPREVRA